MTKVEQDDHLSCNYIRNSRYIHKKYAEGNVINILKIEYFDTISHLILINNFIKVKIKKKHFFYVQNVALLQKSFKQFTFGL